MAAPTRLALCLKIGQRAVAALLVATSFVTEARAFSILPEDPSVCDCLTLVIFRSFPADCLWRATPIVTTKPNAIEIVLDVQGSETCDTVITDKTFKLPIGSFPVGTYEVMVRWSDSDIVESSQIVINAECKSNRPESQ